MGGTNDFHDSISTDSSSSGIASSTSASANAAASSSLDPTTSSALATSDDAKHSGSVKRAREKERKPRETSLYTKKRREER